MRNVLGAATLLAVAVGVQVCAQPALAAPLTYDCKARMTSVPVIPPIAAGDASPWQCLKPNAKPPLGVHWQRNALEYCRIAVNVYDQALAAAQRMAKRYGKGKWIVVMDADETVIDNSLFERERLSCGGEFKDEMWRSWVGASMAPDVPGAAAFTNAVHALGGYVAIVTNRSADQDAITQATLKKAGIWFDYEIGVSGKDNDKTERWRGVKTAIGARFGGKPRVVMWIGDQVTDLAILDKAGRIERAMSQDDSGTGATGIGDYLFLLPNPMYGNWQKNPND